jgi:hypothetical protein
MKRPCIHADPDSDSDYLYENGAEVARKGSDGIGKPFGPGTPAVGFFLQPDDGGDVLGCRMRHVSRPGPTGRQAQECRPNGDQRRRSHWTQRRWDACRLFHGSLCRSSISVPRYDDLRVLPAPCRWINATPPAVVAGGKGRGPLRGSPSRRCRMGPAMTVKWGRAAPVTSAVANIRIWLGVSEG